MAKSLQNTSSLPINIEELLKVQGVEKQRVEFKKAWKGSKQGRGQGTYWQVLHTICAFANDFYNDNGGYIIIGLEEDEDSGQKRQIKLPPCGIPGAELDRIQKEIMGACQTHIQPNIFPILSPEVFQGQNVLVIWTLPNDNGPHQCRETEKGPPHYYIRKGTLTKMARVEEVNKLRKQTSKAPPFDSRMAKDKDTGKLLSIQDIDRVLVDIFLGEVKNDIRKKSLPAEVLYEGMDLVIRCGDHKEGGKIKPTLIPRNVALLFFNRHPERHFRGAKIEITCFTQKNEVIEEKIVTGPIHQQVEDCLSYIMEKTSEEVSYLYTTYSEQALHEAVVNAVYHRSYEPDVCDPTKVHIRPDGIEIISYPGPHPSLKPEHFQDGRNISSVPERNNRIGEFLKMLGLANTQNTGINTIWKTMKQNRVQPSFTFDASLFQVTLSGHRIHTGRKDKTCGPNAECTDKSTSLEKLVSTFKSCIHFSALHPFEYILSCFLCLIYIKSSSFQVNSFITTKFFIDVLIWIVILPLLLFLAISFERIFYGGTSCSLGVYYSIPLVVRDSFLFLYVLIHVVHHVLVNHVLSLLLIPTNKARRFGGKRRTFFTNNLVPERLVMNCESSIYSIAAQGQKLLPMGFTLFIIFSRNMSLSYFSIYFPYVLIIFIVFLATSIFFPRLLRYFCRFLYVFIPVVNVVLADYVLPLLLIPTNKARRLGGKRRTFFTNNLVPERLVMNCESSIYSIAAQGQKALPMHFILLVAFSFWGTLFLFYFPIYLFYILISIVLLAYLRIIYCYYLSFLLRNFFLFLYVLIPVVGVVLADYVLPLLLTPTNKARRFGGKRRTFFK